MSGAEPAGVGADALESFVAALLGRHGTPETIAAEVARHLVGANLAGHDSHGVLRLAAYVAEIASGSLHPAATPELLRESPATALFDARRGFGHFSSMVATEWAMGRAATTGLAAAAVRHSGHVGRLGEYTERIAEASLIGVATVGQAGLGGGSVAPFGGASTFLGTNPWSVCVPAAGHEAMLFDAATSTMAEGKVRLARAKGELLPYGVIRDREGRPTRDPVQLYEGGTQTGLGAEIAGHKGFGLALAAALVGGLAMIGDAEPTTAGTGTRVAEGEPFLAGFFVLAIAPAVFGEPAEYLQVVGAVLNAVGRVRPVPGVERVLVPGEPEAQSRRRRGEAGIPLDPATREALAGLAADCGLDPPF
ncbi:MAG: Ldh family oxidoreductase [Candidatus Dormibacteraeota bacterium]|nr:Ldh family oxidoreductase [Candidatus Dormibacteraeota bacterium]